MTMFRRVFSNHFDGQGPDVDPPKNSPVDHDVAPAPPSMPPQIMPHEKPSFTEMSQMQTTGASLMPETQDDPVCGDGSDDVGADLAARAAEVHTQMLQRDMKTPSHQTVVPVVPTAPAANKSITAQPAPRSGRTRTRLLGFDAGADVAADPITSARRSERADTQINPAGWLAIVKGKGAGHHFAVIGGVAMVGRGEDQGIRLDFGDQAISRQNHAALAYDAEDNKFYLGHGGKSNIIKLNGRPVLSTEEIFHGDMIRIGETTLRLVALCDEDFQWGKETDA